MNLKTAVEPQRHQEQRAEFEHAVKDYLAVCRKEGVHPEKPASGKLLLRVPPEVHGRALVAAQAAGKNLNQWATEVLEHAVQPDGQLERCFSVSIMATDKEIVQLGRWASQAVDKRPRYDCLLVSDRIHWAA